MASTIAYRTVLHPEAELDIESAARWYEEKRPGLGDAFTYALTRCLDEVEAAPLSYQKVHGDVRRWFAPRPFPYSVYFEVADAEIVILGVFHGKQDEHAFRASRRNAARAPRR